MHEAHLSQSQRRPEQHSVDALMFCRCVSASVLLRRKIFLKSGVEQLASNAIICESCDSQHWCMAIVLLSLNCTYVPHLSALSRSGKISMRHPGLPLPRGQSFAHITLGLADLVICKMSPTLSCRWASVSAGLWCSSELGPILCPLSRAVLPGQPSRATFAGQPVHCLRYRYTSCGRGAPLCV